MPARISLEAIQKIIGKEQQIPEGFLTTKQWGEQLGTSKDRTTTILGHLKSSGCLEVGFIEITNLMGRKSKVPAYKINLPKGKK